jgi:hypothetical protein
MGDKAISTPSVRGLIILIIRSTFDSYFQADYCLVIAKEDTRTNYFADSWQNRSFPQNKSKIPQQNSLLAIITLLYGGNIEVPFTANTNNSYKIPLKYKY